MKTDFYIRQEHFNDYPAVEWLNNLAFGRSFEAELVNRLRHSKAFIPELSLVAVDQNNTILGHILFTKVKVNLYPGHKFLGLAPMAVLPEHQKKGIGAALINEGLKIAHSLDFDAVFVLGHKDYYPKFDFNPTSKWKIKSEFDVPEEYFMGLELKHSILNKISATVIYDEEFNNV